MTLVLKPTIDLSFSQEKTYECFYNVGGEFCHKAGIYAGDKYILPHSAEVNVVSEVSLKSKGKIILMNTTKEDAEKLLLTISIYQVFGKTRVPVGSVNTISVGKLKKKSKKEKQINLSVPLTKENVASLRNSPQIHISFKAVSSLGETSFHRSFPVFFKEQVLPCACGFTVQIVSDVVLYEENNSNIIHFETEHENPGPVTFTLRVIEKGLVKKTKTAKFKLYVTDINPKLIKQVAFKNDDPGVTFTQYITNDVTEGEFFSYRNIIDIDYYTRLEYQNFFINGSACFFVSNESVSPTYPKKITDVQLSIQDKNFSLSGGEISDSVPKISEPFNVEILYSSEVVMKLAGTTSREVIRGNTRTEFSEMIHEVNKEFILAEKLPVTKTNLQVSEPELSLKHGPGEIIAGNYVIENVEYGNSLVQFNGDSFNSEEFFGSGTVARYPIQITYRRDGLRVDGISKDDSLLSEWTTIVGDLTYGFIKEVYIISKYDENCFQDTKTYSRGDWFGNSINSEQAYIVGPSQFTFGTITYDPLYETQSTNIIPDLVLYYPSQHTNPATLSLQVSHGISFALNNAINPELAVAKFQNLPGSLAVLNGKTCAEVQSIFEEKVSTNIWGEGLDLPDQAMSLINELVYPIFQGEQDLNQEYLTC